MCLLSVSNLSGVLYFYLLYQAHSSHRFSLFLYLTVCILFVFIRRSWDYFVCLPIYFLDYKAQMNKKLFCYFFNRIAFLDKQQICKIYLIYELIKSTYHPEKCAKIEPRGLSSSWPLILVS